MVNKSWAYLANFDIHRVYQRNPRNQLIISAQEAAANRAIDQTMAISSGMQNSPPHNTHIAGLDSYQNSMPLDCVISKSSLLGNHF